jgi:endonuclease-3
VAVVLSAQATDVGVNKATRALFRDVKTPAQMVALGEDGLKSSTSRPSACSTPRRRM